MIIVVFDISDTGLTAEEFSARLKAHGLLVNSVNAREMRITTHYDATREACGRAIRAIQQVVTSAADTASIGLRCLADC